MIIIHFGKKSNMRKKLFSTIAFCAKTVYNKKDMTFGKTPRVKRETDYEIHLLG